MKPRIPELLRLEGWYRVDRVSFKISCRFHDILRCAEFNGKTKHFRSCFARGKEHQCQPTRRCDDPRWAIAYVPDKHGNFIGRAFLKYQDKAIHIFRVKGNTLTREMIKEILEAKGLTCLFEAEDEYIVVE